MGSLLLRLVLQYLESHPEQVAALIEQGVEAAINTIKKHNESQKVQPLTIVPGDEK